MGFPPWARRDASSVNRSHKLVTRSSVDKRESINIIRNIVKQVQNYFFWEPWNEIREKLVIGSKAGNRGEFPLTLFSLGSEKKHVSTIFFVYKVNSEFLDASSPHSVPKRNNSKTCLQHGLGWPHIAILPFLKDLPRKIIFEPPR